MPRCMTCPLRVPDTAKCRFYGVTLKRTELHAARGCFGYDRRGCFAKRYGQMPMCGTCGGAKNCKAEKEGDSWQ